MKKEIEIEDNGTYYTLEYSAEFIEGEEEVGISSGVFFTIHAIWINLIYREDEDIIVLYSDRKEQNHVIDISAKSKIDVDFFKELLINELNK